MDCSGKMSTNLPLYTASDGRFFIRMESVLGSESTGHSKRSRQMSWLDIFFEWLKDESKFLDGIMAVRESRQVKSWMGRWIEIYGINRMEIFDDEDEIDISIRAKECEEEKEL